jgi:NAD(P)-dependent dehydrogenase (short-subunit alcohol dehydrogenase family)
VDVRVKSLYRTMQALYEQVASPGTFLISATRLGGQHGYGEAGAHAPLGGAVAGFTKAYKRERPEALVKVVDFEPAGGADAVAQTLLAETLRDPGAVEIGYADGLRWTVGLEPRSLAGGLKGQTLGRDTVFLVTGAAGSIVSAITADLAAASGGTFYLLDVIPEPDQANPDLRRFEADKDGLKRDLFARIQARGERATPAMVERDLAAIERARAAQSAMDAVRAAGGAAHYYAVNMTDGEAVARVVGDIRKRSGRIDVMLHAAGIERSHPLPAKEPREFDLVFDVKSAGCFHLLRAIGDMPLGALVAFSSIAGRFGNAGQTDYSAANDFLCKLVSNFRRTRQATRAIAIDWTAWGGIGMATRGSIPKVMEAAGIDMLPPAAGIPWIRRELTSAASGGEIVVARSLGLFLKELDATGGFAEAETGRGPMAANARIDLDGRLTVEARLDPAIQPFLHDHAIEGTPVLPGVMGIEAFAEAARLAAPGWEVESIENVDFLAPFKFYRGEPRTVTVQAELHPEDGRILARCELTGRRNIAGQSEPQAVTHFTGQVRLARQAAESRNGPVAPRLDGLPVERADIYRVYFHGPAYQVLKKAWCSAELAVGELWEELPDNHHPASEPLALEPRLIELCFQTAGLWEMVEQHRMGLPRHVDLVSAFGSPSPAPGPFYAVVTPNPARECFDAEVVDGAGKCRLRLRGYRTVVFKENVETAFAAAATAAG